MFESKFIFTEEQYAKYYNERFIYAKELMDIWEIIKSNDSYRILILGAPGSGKTTLLYQIRHYIVHKEPTKIIKGFDTCDNVYNISMHEEDPLFIDGLDEMENPYGLLHFLKEMKCNKIVCTSCSNVPLDKYFTHIIKLVPTREQIMMLIKRLELSESLFNSLISNTHINGAEVTLRDVFSLIVDNIHNSDIREFYSKYRNFLYRFGNGIDFSSDNIYFDSKIIIPSKEIIRDVSVVDNSLLQRAKENPQIILDFSPREFERMVCELLDKQGYKVKLTKQTRDGGKDIIVVQKSVLGEFCIYVECKKYDASRPVSVGLVRELYGTVMADNATAGMIITTSYFTKDAKDYTEKIKHRMTLKDYNDLVQELNRINY